MSAAATAIPPAVQAAVAQAGTPYWQNVRHARLLLAKRFNRPWDPNKPIPSNESWVCITAMDDGTISLEGTTRSEVRTFECTPEIAATKVAERTHRLATGDEISSFMSERSEREKLCALEEERVNPHRAAQRSATEANLALARTASAIERNTQVMMERTDQEGDPASPIKKR